MPARALLTPLCAIALAFAASAALAHHLPAAITAGSIARAQLGLGAGNYERILGRPFRVDNLEGSVSRLVFPRKQVEVYFARPRAAGSAIAVLTWNRTYRASEGVGPCSPVAKLKQAYGAKPRPFRVGGTVSAYLLGELIFTVEGGKRVGVVALGRTRQAVFIALNATECG